MSGLFLVNLSHQLCLLHLELFLRQPVHLLEPPQTLVNFAIQVHPLESVSHNLDVVVPQVGIVLAKDRFVIKSHQVLVDDVIDLLLLLLREVRSVDFGFIIIVAASHSLVLLDALRELRDHLICALLHRFVYCLGHLSSVKRQISKGEIWPATVFFRYLL